MKDIETWLKNRYSEQLIHANSAFISSIIHDYYTEVVKNNAVLSHVSGSLPIKELEPIVRHAIFEAENPIKILQEDNEYDKRFIEALRDSGYDIVRQ